MKLQIGSVIKWNNGEIDRIIFIKDNFYYLLTTFKHGLYTGRGAYLIKDLDREINNGILIDIIVL